MIMLPELLKTLGTQPVDIPAIPVAGLALDNRQIQEGMVFVALQGTQAHGLQYAQAAVDAGAVAVLYEADAAMNVLNAADVPELSVPVIAVEQLAWRLGEIAAHFYQYPSQDLFVVGITGTDGKTSVSHFVAEALNAVTVGGLQSAVAAVIGTLGIGKPGALQTATHTTPDAITVQHHLHALRATGFTAVAMEVSSHALDQGRVNGVGFDVAVLTNLTRDHLDYHKTVEAYAAAKRRLFDWGSLQAVVVNVDDAFGQQIADELAERGVQVIAYSATGQSHAGLRAGDAVFDHDGIHATIDGAWGQGMLHVPLLGRFNLDNVLAALGVLLAKGLGLAGALNALQNVRTVPGRMERIEAQDKLVVVDYAHTPGALESVLKAVRVHTQRNLICVFGCGGDRDAGKRPLMAQAAEQHADVVIVTDDNPRTEDADHIFEDIRRGFSSDAVVVFEHDRAAAIRFAVQQAHPGDAVLIAGKGHETVQLLHDRQVPFDDRQQAAQALQELAA